MVKKIWLGACVVLALHMQTTLAQKIDDERMKRDIEVAENVLSTLIKQEVSKERNAFFGLDVKGTYQPGYGITFRLPMDLSLPYMMPVAPMAPGVIWSNEGNRFVISSGDGDEIAIGRHREELPVPEAEAEDNVHNRESSYSLNEKMYKKRRLNSDSLRESYNAKMIQAAKDFIVDYGDFISQLQPNEKIVVTNQGETNRWYQFNPGKRSHISVEGNKADITALRQGKLTRDQALGKIKVINTESVEADADVELMTTIFNRLYRSDLSKTYFTDDNIYYERLRDYGVIYYMQVYSSNQSGYNAWNMPTLGLSNVDQATRDKKVAELYPKFEQDLKENVLEYGRTLKSLKDEESLVFNIGMTRCKGCNIPSTLEVSVKSSVLKDYAAGKIEKSAALAKFTVKKGPNQ